MQNLSAAITTGLHVIRRSADSRDVTEWPHWLVCWMWELRKHLIDYLLWSLEEGMNKALSLFLSHTRTHTHTHTKLSPIFSYSNSHSLPLLSTIIYVTYCYKGINRQAQTNIPDTFSIRLFSNLWKNEGRCLQEWLNELPVFYFMSSTAT